MQQEKKKDLKNMKKKNFMSCSDRRYENFCLFVNEGGDPARCCLC